MRALAEAEQRAVPLVRKTSVRADKEGEVVVEGRRTAGTGYREYAVAVVSTMRNVRRGFESDRSVVRRRRREVGGREVESAASWADAS